MDPRIKIFLLMFIGWIMVTEGAAEPEFDCMGRVSGVCMSPINCQKDFKEKCTEEGSLCCPERLLNDVMVRGLGCTKEKCISLPGGFWRNRCPPKARRVCVNNVLNKRCCKIPCVRKQKCQQIGGECVSKNSLCIGKILKGGCKGVNCKCCVNTKTTTSSSTTIPSTTTSGSTTKASTTTSGSTTKASTTTSGSTTKASTTAASSSTTEASTTSSSKCPITGEPAVDCDFPMNCEEYGKVFGLRKTCPVSNCPPVDKLCISGGWKFIIYRNTEVEPRCNFDKTWVQYRRGFNDGSLEFWIGNRELHSMTGSSPHQMQMVGVNAAGQTRKLFYNFFSVGDQASKYQLKVGGFRSQLSTGVDLFISPPATNFILTGMPFTTHDKNNANGNCAKKWDNGGWWYNSCSPIKATSNKFIHWYFWDEGVLGPEPLQEFYIMIKEKNAKSNDEVFNMTTEAVS